MPGKRPRLGTDPLTWVVENGDAEPHPDVRPKQPGAPKGIDVLGVRDKPLSQLLADYFICRKCGTVGRGAEYPAGEFVCQGCREPLVEAMYYFKKPVHTVIDLMQNTYQSSLRTEGSGEDEPGLDIGLRFTVLVLFCELFKIVQEHLLRHIMAGLRIGPSVAGRLLADNRDPRHRVARLFPTLTGESWRDAVEKIIVQERIDYLETTRFIKTCIDACDAFARSSDVSEVVGEDIPHRCMLRIESLLELHAALHNRYVPAIHVGTRTQVDQD